MSKSDLTKRALAAAFRDLLETMPLEQVTVTAVTARCGVNRQTFYYHFHDIYDLIGWSVEQRLGDLAALHPAQGAWQEGLLTILQVLQEDRDLVYKLMHAMDPGFLRRFLRDRVSALVAEFIDGQLSASTISAENRLLIARFYAAGLIDVVECWVDEGMREPPARLVERLSVVVRGDITSAISRLAEV